MFLLAFFILLLEFFTQWIFEPANTLLANIFEVRIFPWITLIVFIFIFSKEKKD